MAQSDDDDEDAFDTDSPLKPADARQRLRKVLEDGEVIFTPHARREMAKDNIAEQEVFTVLRGGAIDPAEFENDEWRYRIHRMEVWAVVAFEPTILAVVVTAWRKKR